jgi:endonuclease YncB( thermonuclease family)
MKSKIAVIFLVLFIVIVALWEMYLRKQTPETEIVFSGDVERVARSCEVRSKAITVSLPASVNSLPRLKEALGDFEKAATLNRQHFKVAYAVDGDTVKLTTGETLRYIGIDTPETKHPRKPVEPFGKEASAVNEKLVSGKEILVEFNVTKRDKYGRLLGYVFLEDGTFVNAELVKKGYAKVITYPPNVKYAEFFRKLQAEAIKHKRGLWK